VSKRRYFYGLRVHLVTTGAGEPVEFCLAAASEADISLFKEMSLDLPEGSIICADKGYTDYHYEDLLEEVGLHLKAQRKKRSKRPMPAWEEFLSKPTRQYIETVFSNLSALFARKIHAVTAANLSGADLTHADLSGALLRGANLIGAASPGSSKGRIVRSP